MLEKKCIIKALVLWWQVLVRSDVRKGKPFVRVGPNPVQIHKFVDDRGDEYTRSCLASPPNRLIENRPMAGSGTPRTGKDTSGQRGYTDMRYSSGKGQDWKSNDGKISPSAHKPHTNPPARTNISHSGGGVRSTTSTDSVESLEGILPTRIPVHLM